MHQFCSSKLPKHVAIIMDGNGRWAKLKDLPRIQGHQAGAHAVRTIVEESRKLEIPFLTLYAFSSENWLRPQDEVSALMELFSRHLESELPLFLKHDIRLRVIGDLSKLSPDIQGRIDIVQSETARNNSLNLTLAISYGGRAEILSAVKQFADKVVQGESAITDLTEESFQQYLYAPDLPDPDLLIRTSGECRISNFLLWQLAYSEIVITKTLWPDFDVNEYHNVLHEYEKRSRRFGLTSEQLGLDLSGMCNIRDDA